MATGGQLQQAQMTFASLSDAEKARGSDILQRTASKLVDKLDKKLSKNDHSRAAAEHFGSVRMMLAGSCWERNCERREPKSVIRPLDGLASGRRRT